MSKKTLITAYTFILFLGNNINAQQIPIYGNTYINPYLLNPSSIGLKEHVQTFAHYRKQWDAIPGSPEEKCITIDGPVHSNKIGLGLMLFNDQTDIISNTGGALSYRYAISFKEVHKLYMGLSLGALQNKIYFDKIKADYPQESTILTNTESRTNIDANFGISYQINQLRIGLAAYQILWSRFAFKNYSDRKNLSYSLVPHYTASVEYRTKIKNNLYLEPGIVLRSTQGMPSQIDLSAFLNWKNDYWFGAAYRYNSGCILSLGGVFYKKFTVGYAYEITTENIRAFSGGTHEVVLGYKIFPVKPAKAGDNFERKEFDKLVELNREQSEELEKLRNDNEKLKAEIEKTSQDVKVHKEEIDRLSKIFEHDSDSISLYTMKYAVQLSEIVNTSNDTTSNAYYIVVGAYLRLKDAKLFQKILERELNLNTSIKVRDDGKFVFVYTQLIENQTAAKKEFQRLKKLDIDKYINGNLWIFKDDSEISQ